MTIDVDAVYEDGVLKPERPLALKEKAKVHVTIEARAEETPAAKDDDDPTGWKAIDALRGIVKDAPPDMAENHDKYLYGGPDE
jgi:predicted DNA-binding antitoxin AbrB/MazE fold protein